MFESLDNTQKEQSADEPVTLKEALGVYVLILALCFGSLLAFILLHDRLYGIQYATLISYSGAVFIWTFFRTRGVKTRHKLSAPYVQEQLPRLLMIHCVYLLAIFFLETWALAIRPSMSSWWLTGQGRDMPPFDFGLMLIGMAIGISQVVLSRRILGNAKKQFLADSVRNLPGGQGWLFQDNHG